MSQFVAVDWSRSEARYVLASGNGSQLKIETAGTVLLKGDREADVDAAVAIGESLREALAGRKLNRAVTLVGVDRAKVEVLDMSLPPALDEELPELVANQALRELPMISEESIVDFKAASGESSEPRLVTAFALSPEERLRIETTCHSAGLAPTRILWRSYGTASLYQRAVSDLNSPVLLINLLDGEADLIVLDQGESLFFRTVRLPASLDEEATGRRLLAEINRTLMVVPQIPSGRLLERACVFGHPDEHRILIDLINDNLPLSAESIDPFASLKILDQAVPENSGRFASLLGMLLVEAQADAQPIDFLHPRKQPTPPDRRRSAVIGGGLAAAVLFVGFIYVQGLLGDADQVISEKKAELRTLEKGIKKAEKKLKVVDAIQQWNSREVIWLDEFSALSQRFPPGRDAVVLKLAMTSARSGGGTIALQGLARDPLIVERMEKNVRDEFHEVRTPRVQERKQENAYTWHFETSIRVTGGDKSQYVGNAHSHAETVVTAPSQKGRKPKDGNPISPKTTLHAN